MWTMHPQHVFSCVGEVIAPISARHPHSIGLFHDLTRESFACWCVQSMIFCFMFIVISSHHQMLLFVYSLVLDLVFITRIITLTVALGNHCCRQCQCFSNGPVISGIDLHRSQFVSIIASICHPHCIHCISIYLSITHLLCHTSRMHRSRHMNVL